MARLVKLDRGCETGCGRVRSLLLLDRQGHPHGEFCERCGTASYAKLQADEDRRFGSPPLDPPEFADGRLL